MNRTERIAALKAAAKTRILILDGAWGAMIQRKGLTEADFRGERFKHHAVQLKGDNDNAISSLALLANRYPDSLRAGDAAFRSAEWLYARGRYDQAEPLYLVVLKLGKGPQRTLPYTACESQRCEASMAMDDAMIKDALASHETVLTIVTIDGRDINFKMDIGGIDKVFADLRH